MKPIVLDTSFFLPDQPFFTQSIGYNETLLHTHTFFEIFFVDSGKAIHNINGKTETVQKNDLVFCRPQDVHLFKYLEPNYFYHTDILFTEELFDRVKNFLSSARLDDFLRAPMPFHIQLSDHQARILHDYIDNINKIPNTDPDTPPRFFVLKLSVFLSHFR